MPSGTNRWKNILWARRDRGAIPRLALATSSPSEEESNLKQISLIISNSEDALSSAFEVTTRSLPSNNTSRSLGGCGVAEVLVVDNCVSFAEGCNEEAEKAKGEYLAFLKPGVVLSDVWLKNIEVALDEEHKGYHKAACGLVLNENGLIWHCWVAFDINNAPYSIYRFLPLEMVGRQRIVKAAQGPLVVSRGTFLEVGGFSTDLYRFEDIDLCLKLGQVGNKDRLSVGKILYVPGAVSLRVADSWRPTPEQDLVSRARFFARWAGKIGQDDIRYMTEDGLDFNKITALYRELAARAVVGATQAIANSIMEEPI